jgi:predicted dehydrogenase
VVGVGGRGLLNLATKIAQDSERIGLRIGGLCDTSPARLTHAVDHLAPFADPAPITRSTSAAELVNDPDIDIVMITTPQDAHEEPFTLAAAAGKLVYCEKPLAASPQACQRMRDAVAEHQPRTIFGLTRRYENSWMTAHQLIADGAIGPVRMVMLRSVIPYFRYYQRWFRRTEWSGGLLNEKSSHHFDMVNWFAGSQPTRLTAIGGRSVFAPRDNYPARCRECDLECPYRASARPTAQDAIGDTAEVADPRYWNDHCVYSPEADIIDHAAATIQYANGVIGTVTIAIFGPRADDQETLEVVGDRGRIRLTRHTGQLDLVTDHGAERRLIDARDDRHSTSHFGADYRLLESLAAFGRGDDVPVAGFNAAFTASMMAFAAQESIDRDGQPTDLSLISQR